LRFRAGSEVKETDFVEAECWEVEEAASGRANRGILILREECGGFCCREGMRSVEEKSYDGVRLGFSLALELSLIRTKWEARAFQALRSVEPLPLSILSNYPVK
jgi:hypothetical protein